MFSPRDVYLYGLTLQAPQGVSNAVFGNFSGPRSQEVVVSRGSMLELLRPEEETGKIHSVLTWNVFGVIRSLMTFRLTGGEFDYLVVGSDSGRLVILQYNQKTNKFDRLHNETYGKSGCRRIVPGQFLAKDPRGRAILVGALERQKFVYVLNRDSDSKLVISSPLEAHKSQTACLDIVGLDVEFENPLFAALEVDFSQLDDVDLKPEDREVTKNVVFYELDLGLNHVTRKHSQEVDPNCNKLIPVYGGSDGPGGVLVCSENWVIYMNEDHEEVRAPLPRRTGYDEDKGLLIVAYASHKQKDMTFFLLQSELGDIYKVTLDVDEDNEIVNDVHVKYFDTIPPATALCVLRVGFLFAPSEFGNHYLFTFTGIGDEDDSAECSSQSDSYVYFSQRELRNLAPCDEVNVLNPIIDMRVENLAHEDTKQIYALCGRGTRSTLRILRHGLAVSEMAVSPVPGIPNGVWSVKKNSGETYDNYIVVSFPNSSLVLSIGDTVEEVSDSGFLDSTTTLSCTLLGKETLMQIHPNGIRLVRTASRINEWKPPGNKQIDKCATNGQQVVIAMTNGELAYFELDQMGQLTEIDRSDMGGKVTSVALAPVPEGRLKARFMAVGLADQAVKMLDLEGGGQGDTLKLISTQMLPNVPESLLFLQHPDSNKLQLFCGLQNGVQVVSTVDQIAGHISDARKRVIGHEPVKLFPVEVQRKPAVLAISSRNFLNYYHQGKFRTTPLSYEALNYAWSFSSEQCPEGIVSVAGRTVSVNGKTLRILTLDKLDEVFNQSIHKLRYTPRKLIVHPITNNLIIIESDHNMYTWLERQDLIETLRIGDEMLDEEDGGSKAEPPADFVSALQPGPGKWASCIRVMDAALGEDKDLIELEDNEAAFSVCTCVFAARPDDVFLIVGTVKDLELQPRKFSAGFIHVYRMPTHRAKLELLHKTEVREIPLALCPYKGMLLVGVGNVLRLYDLGKKKLLRKSENRQFPNAIRTVSTSANRIYVGDTNAGMFYVKYTARDKKMEIVADSTASRYITTAIEIDHDTVAAGDKFGNFALYRMPEQKDEADRALAKPYGKNLNAASVKLLDLNQYHVGDTITSMQRTQLYNGGADVIVYGTLMGGIGVFMPLPTKEDVDFYSRLEMYMRRHSPPLCGRDHAAYRSYYYPVRHTYDGDLCEQYLSLPLDAQKEIAEEMVQEVADIEKRLESHRNLILG